MKDFRNVWIFAQAQRGKLSPTSFELLTAGRKLADDLGEKLCAVLVGYRVKDFAKDLFERGADTVYVCDDPALENYVDDVYAKVLADMVAQYKPNKFLIPATNLGRSLSAKTAVFVGTGLTADATEVLINKEDGQLHATRPTFGGNLMATITCANTRPEMCSLRPWLRAARARWFLLPLMPKSILLWRSFWNLSKAKATDWIFPKRK